MLNFPAELVMSGLTLPRPVNYLMVRIQAPEDVPTDPSKRPFLVVDPVPVMARGLGALSLTVKLVLRYKRGILATLWAFYPTRRRPDGGGCDACPRGFCQQSGRTAS